MYRSAFNEAISCALITMFSSTQSQKMCCYHRLNHHQPPRSYHHASREMTVFYNYKLEIAVSHGL